MEAHATLRADQPLGRLIKLLDTFEKARCDGADLSAKVNNVPDISEKDLQTIIAAQHAIIKSLGESDYDQARLAYQVLDYELRTVLEPALTLELFSSVNDDEALWVCNDNKHVVSKGDAVAIAQAINDVRMKDNHSVGTPEDPSPDSIQKVLDYVHS
ncbi:MAG: hypothetical protein AB8B83_04820 [Bdellovibrionales bacterium]